MKRLVSILLAVVLMASMVVSASAWQLWKEDENGVMVDTTAEDAIKNYEAETGEDVVTHRYYFQMPDGEHGQRGADGTTVAGSWYNDYAQGAGVYWWGGPASCDAWAGYRAMVEDEAQHIYYADLPAETVCFIWNNGCDGGKDNSKPYFKCAAQTVDIASEYPDPGEYTSIPEGAESFDGCIFIIDPDSISISDYSEMPTCGGTWYFYYGNGCYGSFAEGTPNFKSVADNCLNPDHFDENGKHIGGGAAFVRGDYDNDGEVTITDATRVQRILAELSERPEDAFLKGVDADGDGDLTVMDATRIQRFLAELCNMDGSDYTPAA